jgi:hypothetical protein
MAGLGYSAASAVAANQLNLEPQIWREIIF